MTEPLCDAHSDNGAGTGCRVCHRRCEQANGVERCVGGADQPFGARLEHWRILELVVQGV